MKVSPMPDRAKKVFLLEVITDAVIISLPIDLLYLYFAGGWYESNQTILVVELGLLFLLPLFGIWRLYHFITANGKKVEKHKPEEESERGVRKPWRRHYFSVD